jgi:hypothetical protein
MGEVACEKRGMNRHAKMVIVAALSSVSLVACGGSSSGPATSTTPAARDCGRLRSTATQAERVLDACRRELGTLPSWSHTATYDRAISEVRALGALAERGAVEASHAQTAADEYWRFLDEVSPELTNHASLDRAETAAEGILRSREGDGARAAATEAEEALIGVRRALLPEEPVDPCAEAQVAADRALGDASDCPR